MKTISVDSILVLMNNNNTLRRLSGTRKWNECVCVCCLLGRMESNFNYVICTHKHLRTAIRKQTHRILTLLNLQAEQNFGFEASVSLVSVSLSLFQKEANEMYLVCDIWIFQEDTRIRLIDFSFAMMWCNRMCFTSHFVCVFAEIRTYVFLFLFSLSLYLPPSAFNWRISSEA